MDTVDGKTAEPNWMLSSDPCSPVAGTTLLMSYGYDDHTPVSNEVRDPVRGTERHRVGESDQPNAASSASAAWISSCGTREPSRTTAPESRSAWTNGAAQRSSQISSAADEPGANADDA